MNKTLLTLVLLLIINCANAQFVVKMQMPEQSSEELSAMTLFDELLPLDIPAVLSPLGYSITGGTPPYNYEWYENENLISRDSTVVITPTAGNDYTLVIIDENNCSVTLSVTTETASAIKPVNDRSEILLAYYSPGNNKVIIRFNKNINTAAQVNIYDFNGVKHYQARIKGDHIIPLNLKSGFYFIDIKGDGFHYIKKFILP